MPHIRVLFVDTPEIREFLRTQKTNIRTVIAEVLGYLSEEVALFPHRIPKEDIDLADNILPLEFVVDSGIRTVDQEGFCVWCIRERLVARCAGIARINFGIWLITHAKNEFVEYRPRRS